MDWKSFYMSYLTNPQNGWTQEEAKKFCKDAEERHEQEDAGLDFWSKATGLTAEQRAAMLNTTPDAIKKCRW